MLVTGADLVFEKSTIGLLQPKSNSVTATVFAEFFSIADGTENTRGDVRSLFLRPEVRVRRGTSWRKWVLDQEGVDVKSVSTGNKLSPRPPWKSSKKGGFSRTRIHRKELPPFFSPLVYYAGNFVFGFRKGAYGGDCREENAVQLMPGGPARQATPRRRRGKRGGPALPT